MAKILFVEDDPIISKLLIQTLADEKYEVVHTPSIAKARVEILNQKFDLVLLDLVLPDGESFSLIKEVNTRMPAPIIFLTVKNDEESVLKAFSEGASDYVRKPFSQKELLMRIRRLLVPPLSVPFSSSGERLLLDTATYSVTVDKRLIKLAKREFQILNLLAKKSGQLVKREEIADLFGDEPKIERRTIDSHISHLRIKLYPVSKVLNINAIYGQGYRLELT